METHAYQGNFLDELIIDNFAGGGVVCGYRQIEPIEK